MRDNPVKRRLAEGGTAIGTYVMEFFTTGLCRIVANAGADFAIFDMEHGGWGIESLKQQMALAHAAGLTPIINTPETRYERLGLLLDIGAHGLMIPHVESRAQAEELVRSTRYAPHGVRGAGFATAHDDYDASDVRRTMAVENERTLIVAKIESRRGVAAAEEIMSVPGIDVALVTLGDLSLDLGVPGESDHPALAEAMDRVFGICQALGKVPGCAVFDPAAARRRVDQGYRFIQYSWDVGLLGGALKSAVDSLRA
jgi:2-dehydro-3-deoxyglucarate aldolase/4-hydroxy-2-oxoheptanedioate aldolase